MIPLRDDNPTTLKPVITVALISCCVAAFLWQISYSEDAQQVIVYALGVIPAVLFESATMPEEIAWIPPGLTIITSMFLHGGWGHLIGNMLYLWIFGNNIEDSMGHLRFILFYLICGAAAVLAQALPNPDSEIPMIGASGAISGILGNLPMEKACSPGSGMVPTASLKAVHRTAVDNPPRIVPDDRSHCRRLHAPRLFAWGRRSSIFTSGMETLQSYKSNRCKFEGFPKGVFQATQADACCLAELGYRQ